MAKNKDVTIVVLAAGKGTRLNSSLAKVLHAAGGRPLVEHVVRACVGVSPKRIVVVVGHQAEKVEAVVRPVGAAATLQQRQNGTGHAILVPKRAVGNARFVLVLPRGAP